MKTPNFSEIFEYKHDMGYLKTIVVEHDMIGRHGTIAPLLQTRFRRIGMRDTLRILDIGAHDRVLERSLAKCGLKGIYHSVDIDSSGKHDFQDIREVTETYNVICMFELIEHLTFEEGCEFLYQVYNLLSPGGEVYVSTPNPFHPTRYFSDVTHKQHWPASDLFAILRYLGFERDKIEMYGVIYRDIFSLSSSSLPRFLVSRLRAFAWRLLGLDIRGGLLAIATKLKSFSNCFFVCCELTHMGVHTVGRGRRELLSRDVDTDGVRKAGVSVWEKTLKRSCFPGWAFS